MEVELLRRLKVANCQAAYCLPQHGRFLNSEMRLTSHFSGRYKARLSSGDDTAGPLYLLLELVKYLRPDRKSVV